MTKQRTVEELSLRKDSIECLLADVSSLNFGVRDNARDEIRRRLEAYETLKHDAAVVVSYLKREPIEIKYLVADMERLADRLAAARKGE